MRGLSFLYSALHTSIELLYTYSLLRNLKVVIETSYEIRLHEEDSSRSNTSSRCKMQRPVVTSALARPINRKITVAPRKKEYKRTQCLQNANCSRMNSYY